MLRQLCCFLGNKLQYNFLSAFNFPKLTCFPSLRLSCCFESTLPHFVFTKTLYGISAMWECGFLMLKRRPLSWTQTMYGLWRGISSGLRGLFVLIIIPVLRKYFHPRDTTLLFGALLSSAIGQIIFSAGTYDWIIFLCMFFFRVFEIFISLPKCPIFSVRLLIN